MATQTLTVPPVGPNGLARTFIGRVTGKLYSISALGRVTVDTLDAGYLIAQGMVPDHGSGGGQSGKSGTTTIDFGAFPGSAFASKTVTVADADDPNAVLDAYSYPAATADHTADEHIVDPPMVSGVNNGDGTITITGVPSGRDPTVPAGVAPGNTANSQMPVGQPQVMPYGKWSVAWAFLE